jgi:hypothetical protein
MVKDALSEINTYNFVANLQIAVISLYCILMIRWQAKCCPWALKVPEHGSLYGRGGTAPLILNVSTG